MWLKCKIMKREKNVNYFSSPEKWRDKKETKGERAFMQFPAEKTSILELLTSIQYVMDASCFLYKYVCINIK